MVTLAESVILHIGLMKTGTSYLQGILETNRATLRDRGVLWPGDSWLDQIGAVQVVLDNPDVRAVPTPNPWSRLVDQISAAPEPTAIVSMEWLSFISPSKAKAVADSLHEHRVTVVVSVRDLVRTVPAQWQESTQNGAVWEYLDYVEDLTSKQPWKTPGGRHFWHKQGVGRILRAWDDAVGAENIVLLTIPPAGSPRGLLLERFLGIAGVGASGIAESGWGNESLGAASAEVMRRVNVIAKASAMPPEEYNTGVKHALAKDTLALRRSSEPTLVLPDRYLGWARKRSAELRNEIEAVGPAVVGDLAELDPRPPQRRPASRWPRQSPRRGLPTVTDNPSALPTEWLLDAAVDGLAALTRRLGAAS